MVLDQEYVSLEHTLLALKQQVRDSMPYVHQFVPYNIDTPGELFRFLKPELTYKNDPKGIEFIQTLQTLFKNQGQGDCDCFTVAALASLIFLGYEPVYVAIVGKTKAGPTHIYAEVYDPDKGRITAMDFTNPIYNMQRPYKYKQRLLFDLNSNDDMRLQLADKYDDQGYSRVRTIVNRETGELFSCDGGMPLANRAVRKARRKARQDRRIYRIKGREARHDARVDARMDRQQARLQKRVKGDDSGDYDEGGGGDYDNSYDSGEDQEMNDTYELSGIGKTIGKLFKKKPSDSETGKAATDRGSVGAVKIKKAELPTEGLRPPGVKIDKTDWFDEKTAGIPNTFLALGLGAGVLYLASK